MNSEDKTRILRGLVEHEGRWIPIGDKLKTAEEALLPKEKHAEQVATEMVDAPAVTQPSSPDLDDEPLTAHETAAVARFADALKGEETDSWSIPQTKLRNAIYEAAKPVTEECHQTETEYDKYLKAQQKKRKVLIIVAAAVVACAVLLYGLKVI